MLVIELMKGANATVAEAGAKALASIALPQEVYQGGDQGVFEAGGVTLLLEVLSLHKTHAGVCEAVSRALGNIAVGSDALKQAVLAGLPLLLEVLSLHKTHAGVCEAVSIALYNISAGSATRKASIVSAGAVPLLAAVWKDHSGDARTEAHDTLDRLGFNDDGSKK